MTNSYNLTEEQEQCIEAAKLGKNIKIKAFAGSGKTSTLAAIARNLDRKFALIFNKKSSIPLIYKWIEVVLFLLKSSH